MYVAQYSAARVEERMIWRRQLLRWQEAGPLVVAAAAEDVGYPGLLVMSEDDEELESGEVVNSPPADELAPGMLDETVSRAELGEPI